MAIARRSTRVCRARRRRDHERPARRRRASSKIVRRCAGAKASSRRSSTRRCIRRHCSTCGTGCRTSKAPPVGSPLRARGVTYRRRRGFAYPRASPPSAPVAIAFRLAGTTSSANIASTWRLRIDALNITNAEYLEFVEAGGYRTRELWSGRRMEHRPAGTSG